LQIGDARVSGGAQIFEVGDPMQGAPYLSAKEKTDCVPGRMDIGARKEVTVEAEAMKSAGLKVVMLSETPRFDSALYCDGAAEARLGHKGDHLLALLRMACKRGLSAEEALNKVSLFGVNEQVMRCSLGMMERRAAARGLTADDVYRYVASGIEAYGESELNKLRSFGFERITFVADSSASPPHGDDKDDDEEATPEEETMPEA